ncbi:MAG: Hsp20/alpha crystallin family protein [Candidatus Bathyarchaeota archaeon]|nr:Hsp20/alpha crystallin family protein [Candidatus Bathyarchaeota archaeon]
MTWRRRRGPFGGLWDDMLRDFWEFDDNMGKIWDEMQKDPNAQTWYYGYQVNIGPDGKPHVKEFGNVKPRGGQMQLGVREPLVDVSVDEKESTVKVIVEMPGADKDSIKVNATEEHVIITANNLGKPYNAEVPLCVKVDPNTADASYTNGILQVIFKKKGPESPKGVNIRIK